MKTRTREGIGRGRKTRRGEDACCVGSSLSDLLRVCEPDARDIEVGFQWVCEEDVMPQ